MNRGAIEINLTTGKHFVVVPIHEFRNDGPVFGLPMDNGTRLLDADSIRANWNAWVRDLVRENQIYTPDELGIAHPGIDVY